MYLDLECKILKIFFFLYLEDMVNSRGLPLQKAITIPYKNIKKRSVPYFSFPPDLPTELYDDVSPPERGFNIIDTFLDPITLQKIHSEDLLPQIDGALNENYGANQQISYQNEANENISHLLQPIYVPTKGHGPPTKGIRVIFHHAGPIRVGGISHAKTKSFTKTFKSDLGKPNSKESGNSGLFVYSNDTPIYTYELYNPGHSIVHSEACKYNHLKMMILISSNVPNDGFRNAIRNTWGQDLLKLGVGLFFMLGIAPYDSMGDIIGENEVHKDIIVGNFIDSYSNLTLKTLSMLEWFSKNCRSVPIMVKADDDVFINVPKLLEFISHRERIKAKYTIWGDVQRGVVPRRQHVSMIQYPNNKFPDFMFGAFYFMTSDCVKILYNVAQPEPYVRLENVFVTGILANRLNLTKEHVPNLIEDYKAVEWIRGNNTLKNTLAIHMNGRILHEALWRMLATMTEPLAVNVRRKPGFHNSGS